MIWKWPISSSARSAGTIDLQLFSASITICVWMIRPNAICGVEHVPEKHALGLDPMGGSRFSEKECDNK
jgi:hypothetical protein